MFGMVETDPKQSFFVDFQRFIESKRFGFAIKLPNWLIAKAISWYNAGVDYAELFHLSPHFDLEVELVSKVDLRW